MNWIIVLASCWGVCTGQSYEKDWVWQQDPHKIYYSDYKECESARKYEVQMFRKANPGRIVDVDFCMPLDRWLDQLPVVGDPRTDENRRLRDGDVR